MPLNKKSKLLIFVLFFLFSRKFSRIPVLLVTLPWSVIRAMLEWIFLGKGKPKWSLLQTIAYRACASGMKALFTTDLHLLTLVSGEIHSWFYKRAQFQFHLGFARRLAEMLSLDSGLEPLKEVKIMCLSHNASALWKAMPTHISFRDPVPHALLNVDIVILYFHGGGYLFGHPLQTCRFLDSLLNVLANDPKRVTAAVLAVDYPLAPKHPFPAAICTATSLYCWLTGQIALFQENEALQTLSASILPHQVVLVGDSAGGGLCAATSSLLNSLDLEQPLCQVLISPWLDMQCTSPSYVLNRDWDILCGETIQMGYTHYSAKVFYFMAIQKIVVCKLSGI